MRRLLQRRSAPPAFSASPELHSGSRRGWIRMDWWLAPFIVLVGLYSSSYGAESVPPNSIAVAAQIQLQALRLVAGAQGPNLRYIVAPDTSPQSQSEAEAALDRLPKPVW